MQGRVRWEVEVGHVPDIVHTHTHTKSHTCGERENKKEVDLFQSFKKNNVMLLLMRN